MPNDSLTLPVASAAQDRPDQTQARRRRGEAGFTLIELVIVMAIIALLAALVGPQLFGKLEDSKVKSTKAQIELLATALDSFRLDVGRYPAQDESLKVLVEKPATLSVWNGPYLKKRDLPKDAWGHDFIYAVPPTKGGQDYDLYSLGASGKADDPNGIIINR